MRVIEALIYIPPVRDTARWLVTCYQHCRNHGYQLVAVVTRWEDVVAYFRRGWAGVVVIGHRRHLPKDRGPRVEVVTQESTPPEIAPPPRSDDEGPPTPPRRRRPQPI